MSEKKKRKNQQYSRILEFWVIPPPLFFFLLFPCLLSIHVLFKIWEKVNFIKERKRCCNYCTALTWPWKYPKDSFVNLHVCVSRRYADSWTWRRNLAAAVTGFQLLPWTTLVRLRISHPYVLSFQHSFPYAPTHSSLSLSL